MSGPATVVLRDRRAALDIDRVIGRRVGWRGPFCGVPAGRVASGGWGACTFICLPERGRGIAPIAPSSASTLGFAGRNGAGCGAIYHRVFRAPDRAVSGAHM